MITDKLENIHLYSNLPNSAVEFIKNLKPNIELGKYLIDEYTYANVEEYETKSIDNAKYEAHKDYIDVQILLKGQEIICYNDINGLNTEIEYNPDRDIEFFSNSINKNINVKLNGSNFVVLYPHEAHAPQISVNSNAEKVKKVVIKIKFQ